MARDFEKNVFINCPFDDDYQNLLRPLLFSIIYSGLNPRIALEKFDSGEARIKRIIKIIKESKYGIHDLSRMIAKKRGEYHRMNMPFELGIDIGFRFYNDDNTNEKCHLILETKPFRYQKALSDLSNSDIKYHNDDPERLITQIRCWFSENGHQINAGPTKIWYDFNDFMKDFDDKRTENGFSKKDIYNIPVAEYIREMKNWINNKLTENRN